MANIISKHRLPKGFGSIRKLNGNRKNPYAVHPSMLKAEKESSGEVEAKRQTICYVPDWETGYKVLVLYNAGKYEKGIEQKLIQSSDRAFEDMDDTQDRLIGYAKKILAGIELIKAGGDVSDIFQTESAKSGYTFQDVYNSFYDHKFGSYAKKDLARDTKNAYHSAWLKLKPLHNRTLDEVGIDDLEKLVYDVSENGLSKTTISRVVTLIHQLYRYAYARGYCQKTYGLNVQMPKTREETHHQDFTDEELETIWSVYHTSPDPFIVDVSRMILINCYSGFRINEFAALETVIGEISYFKGGLKTAAGKNRIVPVHSKILPLVKEIIKDGSPVFLCGKGDGQFRRDMKKVLEEIGIDGVVVDGEKRYHTPHSCRHTFSRLCESYSVNEADRKRMLGHSLQNDVTNGVYGHRTVKELQEQIEKIESVRD